jgi:hypothetical protein
MWNELEQDFEQISLDEFVALFTPYRLFRMELLCFIAFNALLTASPWYILDMSLNAHIWISFLCLFPCYFCYLLPCLLVQILDKHNVILPSSVTRWYKGLVVAPFVIGQINRCVLIGLLASQVPFIDKKTLVITLALVFEFGGHLGVCWRRLWFPWIAADTFAGRSQTQLLNTKQRWVPRHTLAFYIPEAVHSIILQYLDAHALYSIQCVFDHEKHSLFILLVDGLGQSESCEITLWQLSLLLASLPPSNESFNIQQKINAILVKARLNKKWGHDVYLED